MKTRPGLAAGGDAIAEAPDGRVVFVRGAAPEERVEVEIEQDNATFLRGRVVSVLEAGPARVEPRCPHFGVCGGCSLQHVAPETQTASKAAAVAETLARIGRIDLARVEVAAPWSGAPYGYRTRVRFAVSARGQVGFRALERRTVVDVRACPILAEPLGGALEAIRAGVQASCAAGDVGRELEVECVVAGERALVAAAEALRASRAELPGLSWVGGLEDAVLVDDGHGPLLVHPGVFAQANAAGNAALVAEVAGLAAHAGLGAGGQGVAPHVRVLELYAGSGNFTRVLARDGVFVHTLESSSPAVALARRVLPRSVNIEEADVADGVARLVEAGARFDLVVLDPPRAGAARPVLEGLARLSSRAVIYVSCDPATLARDLRILEANGLVTRRVRAFDLYPETAHVEAVAYLEVDAVHATA